MFNAFCPRRNVWPAKHRRFVMSFPQRKILGGAPPEFLIEYFHLSLSTAHLKMYRETPEMQSGHHFGHSETLNVQSGHHFGYSDTLNVQSGHHFGHSETLNVQSGHLLGHSDTPGTPSGHHFGYSDTPDVPSGHLLTFRLPHRPSIHRPRGARRIHSDIRRFHYVWELRSLEGRINDKHSLDG